MKGKYGVPMIVVRRRRKPRKAKPCNCLTCKRYLGQDAGCSYGADIRNRTTCKWYWGKPVVPKPGSLRSPRAASKSGRVTRRHARIKLQMEAAAVFAVLGEPDRRENAGTNSVFWYGTSSVVFDDDGRLVDWREGSVPLL